MYDEWRLLGGRLTFASRETNASTHPNGLMAVVFDTDDASAALSSMAQAARYAIKRYTPVIPITGGVFRFMFTKPAATATASSDATLWATTATPASNPCSVKTYADNLGTSIDYATYVLELVIQLRSPN